MACRAGGAVAGTSMVGIPNTLDEWTLDAIEQLVRDGIFESRFFDFKETLPVRADESGKARMRKSLAAFANSDGGGFLVLGVRDDRGLDPTDRIAGLDPAVDVPEHFKRQDIACVPRVSWTFRNPPLRLSSGRLIHVIHVAEGRSKPHGIFDGERWIFPKRTDGGNELMSYEEIRDGFRGQGALRRTLLVIKAEAARMRKQAEELNQAVWNGFHDFALRFLFRPGMLDSALAQIVELERDEGLLYALNALRASASAADAEANRLLSYREKSTEALGNLARHTESNAAQVVAAVDRLLGA